jgi:ankyrin repeat protein
VLQHGRTPLHQAAYEGRLDVVSKLLGAGAGVDTATKVSVPPPLQAAQLLGPHLRCVPSLACRPCSVPDVLHVHSFEQGATAQQGLQLTLTAAVGRAYRLA